MGETAERPLAVEHAWRRYDGAVMTGQESGWTDERIKRADELQKAVTAAIEAEVNTRLASRVVILEEALERLSKNDWLPHVDQGGECACGRSFPCPMAEARSALAHGRGTEG